MRCVPHLLLLTTLSAACIPEYSPALAPVAGANCTPPDTRATSWRPRDGTTPDRLTPTEKRIAEQLVGLFEYRKVEPQYDAVLSLSDGRGYTVGRAGFTTGTGDALEVILEFERLLTRESDPTAGQVLARFTPYLPTLRHLRSEHQRTGALVEAAPGALDGFGDAWRMAATHRLFRAAQDAVVERVYYRPAMAAAEAYGLRLPLTLAALFDTIVQHGGGSDPDGLYALMVAAGRPQRLVSRDRAERAWLRRFLNIRDAVLNCAHEPATRTVWRESRDRVGVLLQLLENHGGRLDAPLRVPIDGGITILDPQ